MSLVSKLLRCSAAGLLTLSFAIGGPVRAQGSNDLSGFWNLRVPVSDGTVRETFFELHQSGETVTGRLIRGATGIPLQGTLQGTALHLAAVPPQSPPPAGSAPPFRPFTFDGTFAEGKLMLESHGYRGQVNKGVAERTTQKATEPPARLPLPEIHPLPDNGLARTPPMGWNSWNKFAGAIDDAAVRGMADAMVTSGMKDAGYNYINIDDTWELGRDAAGNMTTNKKFPDMKALADYVHSKGLKIGIYSSPGPKTCAGYEGSYGHEEQDARTFAAWGIDYLKYDLCGARDIYKRTLEEEQPLYQKMGEALAKTGRPIVYSLCQYGDADVWKWGSEVSGNLWRTTGDISDHWESMDGIGFRQIAIAGYAKPGHWNDPDMLEIGNGGMTADEYRTHMSLWSMLAAPLIAGNDLRSMTDETKSILMNKDVIAIDQDQDYKPLQALPAQGKVEVLWRPLHDGSVVVGMFNRGSDAADASLALGSLPGGFTAGKVVVRDLWKHDAVPVSGDSLKQSVPKHGVVLVRVSRAS